MGDDGVEEQTLAEDESKTNCKFIWYSDTLALLLD